jgi:hypothetical protein
MGAPLVLTGTKLAVAMCNVMNDARYGINPGFRGRLNGMADWVAREIEWVQPFDLNTPTTGDAQG